MATKIHTTAEILALMDGAAGYAIRWGDEGEYIRVFMRQGVDVEEIMEQWQRIPDAVPGNTVIYLLRARADAASLRELGMKHPAVIMLIMLETTAIPE